MINKEKFLLNLLNSADEVFVDSGDEDYFCFNPKNINFEVRIPYNQYSNRINVNFVLKSGGGNINVEKGISLTFSSVNEIPTFITNIYKRYSEYFNKHLQNTTFPKDAFDKVECMLKNPIGIDVYPYFLSGQKKSLIIRENQQSYGVQINLGNGIYDYEEPVNLNPLSFLVIDCSYKDETTSFISRYKKIIPAFLVKDYPIISNVVNINKSTNNLHSLINGLYQLDHDSEVMLTAMAFDLDLYDKSNKNKI